MRIRHTRAVLLLAAIAIAGQAHVGSPDIYLDGRAGPYQLFVTVRPPLVIPGVAELEIRSESPGVEEIRAVPMPMTGAGAKFAPLPEKLKVSPQDPQFFTGSLWMMAQGSWQVRLTAKGPQGEGTLAVPVPAAALSTKKMQGPLGALLSILGVFLVGGVVAMVGASVREAKLAPGMAPNAEEKRRGRVAMAIALVILAAVLWYGNAWWTSEAAAYRERVYKPLQMAGTVDARGTLTLKLSDPGWLLPARNKFSSALPVRSMDDLVPDHDHLMHLYAIREPGLDVVYHLHPEQVESGVFQLRLPSMLSGTYKLYADIVHANGFPETMVTTLALPEGWKGRPLEGDDASGVAAPWERASSTETTFRLPDGYRIEWLRGTEPLRAKQAMVFRFRLLDARGQAPDDMRFYMGMLGHAAFVKTDGSVFAHIHPTGSVSMTAFLLAQNQMQNKADSAGMDAAGMNMPGMDMAPAQPTAGTSGLPNEVSFPYGFPTPGRYRIFVQMKHGNTIETGVFDADVE